MNLSLDEMGLEQGDIEISVVTHESGAIEVHAHLSPRGTEIIDGLAASYSLSPDDLFGRVIRRALMLKTGCS